MRYIPLLLIFLFTFSCTIQKRVYRPGWHVTWNKQYRSAEKSNDTSSATYKEVDAVYESQPSEQRSTPNQIETISEAAIELEESEPISNTASLVDNEKDSEPDKIQFQNKTIEISNHCSTFEDPKTNPKVDRPNYTASYVLLIVAFLSALLFIYGIVFSVLQGLNSGGIWYAWIGGLGVLASLCLALISLAVSDHNYKVKIEREEEKEQIKQIDPLKQVKPKDPKQRMKSNIAVGIIIALIAGFIVFIKNS